MNQSNTNETKFRLNVGDEVEKQKGQITNVKTGKLESVSFGKTYEYSYISDADLMQLCNSFKNYYFTHCFEGPLVKVWYDSDGERHFSSQRRIDCSNSFWGDKTKRFGELFTKHGGQCFEKNCSKTPNLTHHFMIIEPSLMVTTRVDIFDNECVIVYLGTVDLEGKRTMMEYDDSVFYQSKNFVRKEYLCNKILYPKNIIVEEAIQLLKYKSERPYFNENVMLFGDDTIYKIKHERSEFRECLAGSTPNLKNRLYTLLDDANADLSDYSDMYSFIGAPTDQELILFKSMSICAIENYTKNIIYARLNNDDFITHKDAMMNRKRNIFLSMLLNTPIVKSYKLIGYWFDYINVRDKIATAIIKHNRPTLNFTKLDNDDQLVFFNKRAVERLQNLSSTCKNYAHETKNKRPFMYNLKYSLYGLLSKEYGCSLYRIEKCLTQLKLSC